MNEISVIYDGKCDFCTNSINWVSKKLLIDAMDYHTADLAIFQLIFEQCSQAVYVIHAGNQYVGADGIVFLLRRRKPVLATLVNALGPLKYVGYRWVVGHRNSWIIQIASKLLSHLS